MTKSRGGLRLHIDTHSPARRRQSLHSHFLDPPSAVSLQSRRSSQFCQKNRISIGFWQQRVQANGNTWRLAEAQINGPRSSCSSPVTTANMWHDSCNEKQESNSGISHTHTADLHARRRYHTNCHNHTATRNEYERPTKRGKMYREMGSCVSRAKQHASSTFTFAEVPQAGENERSGAEP